MGGRLFTILPVTLSGQLFIHIKGQPISDPGGRVEVQVCWAAPHRVFMNEIRTPETEGHLFPVGFLSLAREEEPCGEGPICPSLCLGKR